MATKKFEMTFVQANTLRHVFATQLDDYECVVGQANGVPQTKRVPFRFGSGDVYVAIAENQIALADALDPIDKAKSAALDGFPRAVKTFPNGARGIDATAHPQEAEQVAKLWSEIESRPVKVELTLINRDELVKHDQPIMGSIIAELTRVGVLVSSKSNGASVKKEKTQ